MTLGFGTHSNQLLAKVLASGTIRWLPNRKEQPMHKLTVEGVGQFDVPHGKRLVLALEQDAGVDQLHACGGHARCTTCRVEFIDGEPDRTTVAERDVLAARGLSGVRLSCQVRCDHDMTVRAISRLAGSGRKDAGHQPAAEIEPPPEWIEK
jgi:ferredoxin